MNDGTNNKTYLTVIMHLTKDVLEVVEVITLHVQSTRHKLTYTTFINTHKEMHFNCDLGTIWTDVYFTL